MASFNEFSSVSVIFNNFTIKKAAWRKIDLSTFER